MDTLRNSRTWNHILFIITGFVGVVSGFVSDDIAIFRSFYILNFSISLIYVLWGTLRWHQVRTQENERGYWIYFLGQGAIVFSQFALSIFAYHEPQFSVYVLPVMYQMGRIAFFGRRYAWGVFWVVMTLGNIYVVSGEISLVIDTFLLQLFFIGVFLTVGTMVRRLMDQNEKINALANDLESGNRQLTNYVDQIEKIHADEIRRYQAIDTMRKQLLDSTTHDIRNPLGIIMSYAQLIEAKGKELADTELQEYADGIIDTADRIKNLLVGLLDYTQLETGQAIRKETVCINDFLGQLVQDMQVIGNQNKIEVHYTPLAFNLDLKMDPDQMYRVFENLINNAMKYTPEGGSIHIKTTKDDQNFVIRVIDTGCGISSEAIPNLFKPFFRIRDKDRKISEGAGLGLAIANSIVKHHGGVIQVESELNVGSTFKVVLPV